MNSYSGSAQGLASQTSARGRSGEADIGHTWQSGDGIHSRTAEITDTHGTEDMGYTRRIHVVHTWYMH